MSYSHLSDDTRISSICGLELESFVAQITDEAQTLALISEGPWMIKLPPAVVLTFVRLHWRTTATFFSGKSDGCLFVLRDQEAVVNNCVRVAEISPAVHTATNFLKALSRRQRLFTPASVFDG